MFVRFVCGRPHPRVEAEAGMFDAWWKLHDELRPVHEPYSWEPVTTRATERRRWRALRAAVHPFADLDAPEVRHVRGGRTALFWFRVEAKAPGSRQPGTLLMRAREMASELARWGIEVREIATPAPGRVLWQDAHQVLATPEAPVPRAFPVTPSPRTSPGRSACA